MPHAQAPVRMPPREQLVACLFADGQTVSEISLQTRIAAATIYSYIAPTRKRYLDAGRPARSKITLRIWLLEDGHLPPHADAKPVQ